MKFASKKNKSLDGELCLVSRDLQYYYSLSKLCPHLQKAIENWGQFENDFKDLYEKLNQKQLSTSLPFISHQFTAPLPRAYQWADGSSYLNHVELVRRARGAEMPKEFLTDPLMYQGGSDQFLGPNDPIMVAEESYGIDFESEIAVITQQVDMGSLAKDCENKILLLMLTNDVSLRELIPQELAKGFGFFHSKPASSFSPVAVTPDELGKYWDGKRLHLPLYSYLNHELFGRPNAGEGMHFSFPELIAHAAKTRNLSAGTIIGSGTVSNAHREVGSSCIVEKRMIEIIEQGKPQTPYMRFGDRIRIEMLTPEGENIFGSINQQVEAYDAR
jgi:fumarylacetoacetate (FAA) hydrolase